MKSSRQLINAAFTILSRNWSVMAGLPTELNRRLPHECRDHSTEVSGPFESRNFYYTQVFFLMKLHIYSRMVGVQGVIKAFYSCNANPQLGLQGKGDLTVLWLTIYIYIYRYYWLCVCMQEILKPLWKMSVSRWCNVCSMIGTLETMFCISVY